MKPRSGEVTIDFYSRLNATKNKKASRRGRRRFWIATGRNFLRDRMKTRFIKIFQTRLGAV